MSRRTTGITLITFGAFLVVVGFVGWLTSGGEAVTADQTTTSIATSTVPVAQTAPVTTRRESTTSSAAGATTTTLDMTTTIKMFVIEFAEAITRGDTEFLAATLHPAVVAVHGEPACTSFIEAEILLLESYRLTGDVDGPKGQTVDTAFIEVFTGPVAFTFQGEDFEATAAFANEEGQVRWFAECREG